MAENNSQSTETIKMVEKAMNVLDLLHSKRTPLGVNEIARACGLHASTTYRILKTLEKSGWVYQLEDDRYVTGQKISFVSEKTNLYLALSEVSYHVMNRYTEKYYQPMNLMVRNGLHCNVLQQSHTKSVIDYVPPIHSDLPFYACGGGKILLAEQPQALIDLILSSCKMEPLTPFTITDPELYKRALHETAVQGFAIDHRESSINGSCIAVPVRDLEGTTIASLSFSGFVGITDTGELLKFLPELKNASKEDRKSVV